MLMARTVTLERALESSFAENGDLKVPFPVWSPPAVDPIQNSWCSLSVYRASIPIELVAPRPSVRNIRARARFQTRLRNSGGGRLDNICLFSDDLAADIQDFSAAGGTVVVALLALERSLYTSRFAFLTTRCQD